MKQNDEHQDEGRKNICWRLSVVSRQKCGSFVLSIVTLVVVSLLPRPHLYWRRYKTNLLTWI